MCGCRAQKESKKAEAQAAEARAAAEAELAAAESSHTRAGERVAEAEQEASRLAEELKEYKVRELLSGKLCARMHSTARGVDSDESCTCTLAY